MSAIIPYTLITGASSGIGRAAAMRLSRARRLILHGRNRERLDETLRECGDDREHLLWVADLRETQEIAPSLTDLLAANDGGVQSFVHCAGAVTVLPARNVDHRQAQALMSVNFFAALEVVHLLLKKTVNHGTLSSVLFVSSIFSRFGARGHSAYCASKAALDGYMRALAVELAPEVRVNSILPGAIETPLAREAFADPQIAEGLRRDYPMGVGRAVDIAGMIEFVLSDTARWLTGQQIVVDGGRTANMSLK